ncbi:lantibiotic dehydratase [Actinacidiphila rubida]|uniref:Thiopeptide-type bacteriocin biosynthesis domain-containing protein n=1 Tax=Actinacidiphila rubida TaxID=310780 RepID=A0A1H8TS96_9ACTN|nr:lantibiotic dehydratase [Actinacidiphila rubida]SEO93514.1 thiopeptide-type bacteriocin biosynthesis domain-containing protein [Actinacidiphila rubida]
MAPDSPAGYRWQAPAILRATTWAGTPELPVALDVDDAEATRGWLSQAWQQQSFREAVSATAPVLAGAIAAVVDGRQCQPRQVRRTALSAISYLLRWHHRPTPLGYFAGTAPLAVGGSASVCWTDKHRVEFRADAEWVTDVILRLQRIPELLRRLPVMANNTARRRGDRLVTAGPPADAYAKLMAPVEVSVRLTRPVAAAAEAARQPIVYADLHEHLHRLFPQASTDQIDQVLGGLLDQQILLTSLWAPGTTPDALGHLCEELQRVGAGTLPAVRDLLNELEAIRDDLAASTAERVTARMRTVSTCTPTPVVIDTSLNCDVRIPNAVLEEAQAAVTALYRTTAQPYGYQHWREYHRRFRMHYGAGAVVPVLELVCDSGLGLPAGYVGSERGRSHRLLTDRDEAILTLLQPVLMEGGSELVLTDKVIDVLSNASASDPHYLPRLEAAFEIHSRSTDDFKRGAFEIALTAAPRPGSSLAGRFVHLLAPGHHRTLTAGYRGDPDALSAQLSFPPRKRRNENVTRTPRLLDHVISVGEHLPPGGKTIRLDDIAVTADARHLHLVQLSTGRRLNVRVLHALEAGTQTPALPRFLAEVADARYAAYGPFDFGAAARLPYLPRVRYRRTILAAARWLLTADELPHHTCEQAAWDNEFDTWCTRLRVPLRVSMIEHDQRLLLDLTHPVHRRLLRAKLDQNEHLELREGPPADAHAWIGRAHEVWVSLRNITPHPPTETSIASTGNARESAPLHLPGAGNLLCAWLRAHPGRYDEILTHHLPLLLAEVGDCLDLWWFTRHRQTARPDADQHLDLILHLAPGTHAAVTGSVNNWATTLNRSGLASGLVLADYRPQTGLFGHGPAMDAAHRVFAADSAAALAQIQLTDQDNTFAPRALAAASAFDLLQHLAPQHGQGTDWLIQRVPRATGRLDPHLRDQTLHLTSPTGLDHVGRIPGGGAVTEAWHARAATLAAYQLHLNGADPLRAARALLHQHHVRALGVDPTGEALTLRLARTAALRRQRAAR